MNEFRAGQSAQVAHSSLRATLATLEKAQHNAVL